MSCSEKNMKVQSNCVEHEFQSIYYFSRCTGTWPFSIESKSNGSIRAARVYPMDWLWLFVSICLYLTAAFYYFVRMTTNADPTNNALLSNQMYFINQIVFHLFTAVGIILDLLNREKLINLLDKFTIFDREVSMMLLILEFFKHSAECDCSVLLQNQCSRQKYNIRN